jgi:hypothetical protein
MPSASTSSRQVSMKASTRARPSASRKIGTTATCTGAIRGGSTRPASSPCARISAPISRVETPQEVEWHSSRWFCALENEMS